jgi:YD repeat-containing protein
MPYGFQGITDDERCAGMLSGIGGHLGRTSASRRRPARVGVRRFYVLGPRRALPDHIHISGNFMKLRQAAWLGMLLALASLSTHAQTGTDGVDPYEEFGKHLRAAQEVTPLKSDLFGDQVSLYNGSAEFDVTDIDLPGNSALPVQLRRRLVVDDRRLATGNIAGLGDWDLEMPYIAGTFTQLHGWTIGTADTGSTARCSNQGIPDMYDPPIAYAGSYDKISDGNHIHVPGGADDEILVNTEAKLPAVTDGKSYPWVTKSYYRLGCLAQTANGYPGESFVAISPAGLKYTFNWAAERAVAPVRLPAPKPSQGWVPRVRVFLLATRVEDRFGNWVTYTYSGDHLTKIAANDGREIDITWSGNTVVSARAGTRTWSYGYSNGALSNVTRPDGSRWVYTTTSGSMKTTKGGFPDDYVPPNGHCQLEMDPNTGGFVYAVDAPSGARGTFTFHYQRHYRNDVPFSCVDGNPYHNYPTVYDFFDNFSLTSKKITGAGLGTLNWSYDYADHGGNYFTPSVPGPYDYTAETYIPPGICDTCARSKVVTVTGPGDITRYTFGSSYARNEGRLLKTEVDSLSGAVMKTTTNTYLADSQIASQPFPDNAGISLLPTPKNPMVARIRPVIATTTVQDGDTYTHQTEAFDAFAQPTKAKRFNNIAGQAAIEEQTSYYNDLTHWVLGQPSKVVNLTTGETESQNSYNASNATLKSRARFGETLLNYTYNAQGQLASFIDGNAHTTTLSNYHRGIPQLIHYPDNTSQSAVVDDYGEITAVTDQAGHTTSYAYSASGWPSKITYPAGDEVSWYPKVFSFAYVTAAERGIAGGHWRRTVSTGNASTVTYFDAMLRPLLSDTAITGTAGSDITTGNTYDWRGLTTFASYPVSGAPALSTLTLGTHSTYDALGRLTRTQQNSELGTLTSTMAYLSGARQQVTDPKGNVTTTTYQVFDEPGHDAVIKLQAPAGITQTIARDLYGNPLAITQSGVYGTETDSVAKTLTYDAYHRLCRTREPESGDTVVGYDGANNLSFSAAGLAISGTGCGSEQVAAAVRTTFTYDPMNRVWTIAPPSGTQSTQYLYDVRGNVQRATSGISVWNGTYNFRGMLTGETLSLVGQPALSLGYAHDAYGSLSKVTYPNGEQVGYAPDALGRPTQVGAYASHVAYFPNGSVASFIYGNGTAYAAEQNARQLLSNFSYGTASTLNLSEDFTYDADGNITRVDDLAGGPRNKVFAYDGLNRLVQATASALWGAESYTYDPLNNLRTRLSAGQTSIYHYDASNRLRTITRGASTINSFNYDTRGNTITRNGATLLFDQKNQLTQIPGHDSYAYDANGRRVQKTPTNGGAPAYYFYNHAGQLLYQYEPGKAQTTNFVYMGTRMVARSSVLQLVAPGAVHFNANPNNGSYTVSWGEVPAATSYLLQEKANGGGWVTVYAGSAASTTLSGRAGGSYVYQVKGCAGTTCGGWTSSATLGVRPALPTVTVPGGTINGTYSVSWTAPATATSYDVQERLNGGTWNTIASAITATSISRPGNASGSYTYQVEANSAYGTRGWASSTAVTVDTIYGVLPAAPASLAVPASSNTGSVTVSWSATSLTTRYVVEQNVNGGSSWTAIYNGGNTSTGVAGLADGSYSYRVQSCNAYGCSAWRTGAVLVVTHPPTTAPTLSVPATSANGSFTVSWSGVSGPVSYSLQEQVNGGSWATVQSNGTTSRATSGRGNGTYGYRVQACNVGGCGPWSAAHSVVVLLPPLVPASISVPATSNGSIAISWAGSATATIYGLDQSINGGTWARVYAHNATSTNVVVSASGSYRYRAYACNSSGCSGYATSGAVTVTLPPGSAPNPSGPASNHTGSYTISWGSVSGAASYTLQEQVNGGGWTTLQTNSAVSRAISGKGNGSYGYHVRACNVGGCGPWSAVATVSVTLPPSAPATVTAPSYVHGVQYYVTWSASAGATSYNVQKTNYSLGTTVIVATTSATSTTRPAPQSSEYLQYAVQACNAAGCSAFKNAPNRTQTDPPGPIQ